MRKLALLVIPALLIGGCASGKPEVKAGEEDHFRNPSKTPPPGASAGPPGAAGGPPPQAMGAPPGATNGPSN
jgi:hypothetical protein